MKRTAIKRIPSTRKVPKRIKPRRDTPRSWENRENRNAYRDEHIACELCAMRNADDVHHVCGKEWHGADEDSNLLAVCRRCHDELHANPIIGRVRALSFKLAQGNLDIMAFRNARGCPFGKIANVMEHLPEPYKAMAASIVAYSQT